MSRRGSSQTQYMAPPKKPTGRGRRMPSVMEKYENDVVRYEQQQRDLMADTLGYEITDQGISSKDGVGSQLIPAPQNGGHTLQQLADFNRMPQQARPVQGRQPAPARSTGQMPNFNGGGNPFAKYAKEAGLRDFGGTQAAQAKALRGNGNG